MPPVQIVLEVQGGLVQQVYSSHPELQVTLVDWDCDTVDSPWVVTFPTERHTKSVYVVELPIEPLENLAGTEVEQALEAAESGATRC